MLAEDLLDNSPRRGPVCGGELGHFRLCLSVSLCGLRLNCIRLEDGGMNMGAALPSSGTDSGSIDEING